MKRLVIIPTFNESENIKVLVPRIFKYIPNTSVLVVDDGSPDGTAEVVKNLQRNFPGLYLEQRGKKSGLGSAYRFGFKWGLERDFEELIEMDADMSHRVRDLSKMIELKELELYRDWETDRKSTRLNSSHSAKSRMPSSA